MRTLPGIVHIVDDDEAICDALSWLFSSRGLNASTYLSAETFLERFQPDPQHGPHCLLLDVRMNGMSGLELQEQLISTGCSVPILFLTGHGDVPMAVNALKRGAIDFLQKPFNDNELVDRVIDSLDKEANRIAQLATRASFSLRLALLTPREREVLNRMVLGKYNKVIADELGVCVRTVEVHRSRVLEKMGVKTAVELAHLMAGPNSALV